MTIERTVPDFPRDVVTCRITQHHFAAQARREIPDVCALEQDFLALERQRFDIGWSRSTFRRGDEPGEGDRGNRGECGMNELPAFHEWPLHHCSCEATT